MASPDELIRLARGTGVSVQIGRSVPGRGAWLCDGRVEWFDLAVQRRAIARALRIELSEQEISQLRARLHGAAPDGCDRTAERRSVELKDSVGH